MSIETSPRVLPVPVPGSPPRPTVPVPERFQLENGLRVVAVARPGLPQVAARLVLPAGSAADPAASPGVACVTASLLTEGTGRLSAVELNERIDGLGASLCARAGHDFAEIDFASLAETFDDVLSLVAEVVANPTFPEREFERVRAEVLDALEARSDEPANVADDRCAAAVFGTDHPYGRLPIGTPSGVRAIERSMVIGFHADQYRPDGSVLVIAGDLEPVRLRGLLERRFGGWSGRIPAIEYPPTPTAPIGAGRLVTVDWTDGEQGEIRFGGIGIPRTSPDWVAASVANYILGGSTITGRLGANLREDKGWTYGVRSSFCAGVRPAGWSVETAVDADVVDDAIEQILIELTRMTSAPVDAEELERAKEALVLSLPRAFETPARVVARLATVESFGLPPDYWSTFPDRVLEVNADSVLRVALDHFDADRLVRVVVRPPASDLPA